MRYVSILLVNLFFSFTVVIKIVLITIICLLFFRSGTFAQAKKEILGTFEVGCKVFNYNFTKNTNGIYNFRIESAETETLLHVAHKDSLKKFIQNLDTTVNKFKNKLDENKKNALKESKDNNDSLKVENVYKLKFDSIIYLKDAFKLLANEILNDSSTIDYIYSRKDSLKKLIALEKNMQINRHWQDSTNMYTIFSFSKEIEFAINNASNLIKNNTYPMNVFEQNPFETIVQSHLEKRQSTFLEECRPKNFKDKATELFFQIKARLDFLDDEPSTAYLKLKSNYINCYQLNRAKARLNKHRNKKAKSVKINFRVDNVSVEFEDGTIKNVFADLTLVNLDGSPISVNPIRFKNITPISISTKTDPGIFEHTGIFTDKLQMI
jgi:hypothetical protein